MGSLYCPNCSKAISGLVVISACPNCNHPFNAIAWRDTPERKQKQFEAEQEQKRKQSEAWEKSGRCKYCGGRLTLRFGHGGGKSPYASFSTYSCVDCNNDNYI